MEPSFWNERWERNEIGFHQPDINPDLVQWWPRLAVPAGSSVFVPLCGKTRDMAWLHSRGHSIVGVELSALAAQAFFDDQQLHPRRSSDGALESWQAARYTIYCGDCFDMRPSHVEQCTSVYDRAALIALPPPMRQRYVQHLRTILRPGTITLLLTMDYPQQQMQGPPFSVGEAEVHALFADFAAVSVLGERDTLQSEPRLRARGLERLTERAFELRAR